MGGSSSSISQNIQTNIVNRSTLNAFNEQVNKNIANIVMKSAQNASIGSTQLDTNNIGVISATGHSIIKFDNDNTQNSKISLAALQKTVQTIDLKQTMANQIAEQLKNSVSDSTFNKLVSNAQSSMSSGFLSIPGGGGSSSNVNINSVTNVSTDQETNLKNITKLIVETNADTQSVKKCFTQVLQQQTTNFAGMYATDYATIDITNKNTQIATSFATCKQLTDQTNSVTEKLASAMGIKVAQTAQTTTKTTSTATAKSKNVKKGLGDFIDGIINSVGGLFKGVLGMIIIGVVLIASLGLSGYAIYSKMKSKKNNQESNDSQQGDSQQGDSQSSEPQSEPQSEPSSEPRS